MMRNFVGGWLRRLRGAGAEESRGARPGAERLAPVLDLVVELEASIADGVTYPDATAAGPSLASRVLGPGEKRTNLFERALAVRKGAGAEGAVATAAGMAMTGLRAAAFLDGEELADAGPSLAAAAERMSSLVVHGVGAGGTAIEASGAFVLDATGGQEAIDLTLLARWLTERSLVPGVVIFDGETFERVLVPDDDTIRGFLGGPRQSIEAPTDAQAILFGQERARQPALFDADHPVTLGGLRGAGDQAVAAAGRRVFFGGPLLALAEAGLAELGELTGRKHGLIATHGLDDAEHVLIARGTTYGTAVRVADHLRAAKGSKVGVIGLTVVTPLPTAALASALKGRRSVAVVERLDGQLSGALPPLYRAVSTAAELGGLISAVSAGPVTAGDILRVVDALDGGNDGDSPLLLGLPAGGEGGRFPKRDALVQRVQGAFPILADAGSKPEAWADEGIGLAIFGAERQVPPEMFARAGEKLAELGGAVIRGEASRPLPGAWLARYRAGDGEVPELGRADTLLLLDAPPEGAAAILELVAEDGKLLVSKGLAGALPFGWTSGIRARKLSLHAVDAADVEAWIEAIGLAFEPGDTPLAELALPDARGPAEVPLPELVRRIPKARAAHDSLPRFWGEVLEPRANGMAAAGVIDPLTAAGTVPAGASALAEGAGAAASVPALKAEACTGCGACWVACPDSAISATAIGIEALLTAASEQAGTSGKAADALRRSHKHLAGRIGGQLAKAEGSVLDGATIDGAWEWLAGKMGIADDEKDDYDAALAATRDVIVQLRPMVTEPFFAAGEKAAKGSGELLVLSFDPRACQGCGICVAECPDDALELAAREPERVAALAADWQVWEQLPDTAGTTIARAADDENIGVLSAALLSRHCALAQVADGTSEPGSGERLATRLVASLAEHQAQPQLVALARKLGEQAGALAVRARETLMAELSETDVATLGDALKVGPGSGKDDLGALASRLDELGAKVGFDRQAVSRMVRVANRARELNERLMVGADGMGRARFGVVVAGSTAEWLGRFPNSPLFAPVVVDGSGAGVELARGLAEGLVAEHLEVIRTLRRAELVASPPPDVRDTLAAIAELGWSGLTTGERASCPRLLFFADDRTLLGRGFGALSRLLASDLPVKVVVLDGLGSPDRGVEPALIAMAHRGAFVLAGSIAHGDHLGRGLHDALAFSGPALIHLHTPSPGRHGFAPEATLARARAAVDARAHVLFRYDPGAEGAFGTRASIDGNPEPEADLPADGSLAAWMGGETRFASWFDADGAPSPALEEAAKSRLGVWHALQEVTGVVSPFTEAVRERLAAEIGAEAEAAKAALKAEHEKAIAQLKAEQDQQVMARLTDRLMALAATPMAGARGE